MMVMMTKIYSIVVTTGVIVTLDDVLVQRDLVNWAQWCVHAQAILATQVPIYLTAASARLRGTWPSVFVAVDVVVADTEAVDDNQSGSYLGVMM
jgi:hypothetical protein